MSLPLIHHTAQISPQAKIGENVRIGPFTVIDGPVTIGDHCEIAGHVLIQGKVTIAAHNFIGWGAIIGAAPQDLSFDASTDSSVEIGENNTLREYVTIHRGSKSGGVTRIGHHNFIMTGVHLAHDVEIGNHNVLANNVLLAGHIKVGQRCFLGGGAGFHQFIHIGDFAIVQGNSAISQDVPPYCMVHGQNQLASLNLIGLKRAGFSSEHRSEIKKAFRLLLCGNRTHGLRQAAEEIWSDAAMVLVRAVAQPSRKGIITRPSHH